MRPERRDFFGGEPLGDFYLDRLDSFIQIPESRERLASAIQHLKQEELMSLGLGANYENLIPELKKEDSVAEDIRFEVMKYRSEPSREGFLRINALLAVLTELTILGPKGLLYTQSLREEGKVANVGIQNRQIEAALAIQTMHSAEVISGQGKSVVDIPLGAVARSLLWGEQIHLMVVNPQAKVRDAKNLRLLTDQLKLNLHILSENSSNLDDYRKLGELQTAFDLVGYGKLRGDTRKTQRLVHDQQIRNIANDINYQMIRRSLAAKIERDSQPKKPDVVIGTDRDFVFDFLGDRSSEVWADGKRNLIVDEELAVRSGKPYHQEYSSISTIATYLPDWVRAIAVDKVCRQMMEEGRITRDSLTHDPTFTAEDGTETEGEFNEKIKQEMRRIKETGDIGEAMLKAFRDRLEYLLQTDSLPYRKLLRKIDNLGLKRLIRRHTPDYKLLYKEDKKTEGLVEKDREREEVITEGLKEAWRSASRLKRGVHYGVGPEGTTLREPETGFALKDHRYQGYLDVMLDVVAGVCSLKSETTSSLASTGFLNFLQRAYYRTDDRKHICLVSATLEDLEEEIPELTGNPLLQIDPWIGKRVEFPNIRLEENYLTALDRLYEKFTECLNSGRPLLIVCDDDEEIDLLSQQIREWLKAQGVEREVNIVNYQTSLAEETEIFKKAGREDAISVVNPRGGRMVDIKITNDVANLAGLHVLVWGVQANRAVVRQILARAQRAGQPGDASWIVYKTGGIAALDQNIFYHLRKPIRDKVGALETGTEVSLDEHDNVFDDIYRANYEAGFGQRWGLQLRDTVRAEYTLAVREKAYALLGNYASQEYIDKLVDQYFGQAISETADATYTTARLSNEIKDFASLKTAGIYIKTNLYDVRNKLVADFEAMVREKEWVKNLDGINRGWGRMVSSLADNRLQPYIYGLTITQKVLDPNYALIEFRRRRKRRTSPKSPYFTSGYRAEYREIDMRQRQWHANILARDNWQVLLQLNRQRLQTRISQRGKKKRPTETTENVYSFRVLMFNDEFRLISDQKISLTIPEGSGSRSLKNLVEEQRFLDFIRETGEMLGIRLPIYAVLRRLIGEGFFSTTVGLEELQSAEDKLKCQSMELLYAVAESLRNLGRKARGPLKK